MPYKKIEDLPPAIKEHLPKQAQTIYMKAFNNAFDKYKEVQHDESLPHKIAWSAVKKVYQKEGTRWVKKKKRF